MTRDVLVTVNAGSSTIKIGLFAVDGPERLAKSLIDLRKSPLSFEIEDGAGHASLDLSGAAADDLHAVVDVMLRALVERFATMRIVMIGHRVVHGGDRFDGPALVTGEVIEALEALTTLAPLHQPQSLRLIRAVQSRHPDLPQSASFDTAFHRTQDEVVRRFALPRALHEEGIKRYGFHGLSYRFIAGELARRMPDTEGGKAVVAHLGSGASLCALDRGVSRDTSMGFSTLDGIPMATRCGALDPGVMLHLMGRHDQAEMEELLYHRSGLLGVSGISADSRVLLQSEQPEAMEALALSTFRIAGEIARLGTTLGGLDTLVFTAGIGEHQPAIRSAVCERLAWLGVVLDETANRDNAPTISAPSSRVAVLVLPTDEEQVIATEALSVRPA